MKVTITYEDNFFPLDVSEDLELENLKALLEFESGVRAADIGVYFNGVALKDMKKALKDYGVKDGEILVMIKRRFDRSGQQQHGTGVGTIDWSSVQVPGSSGSATRQQGATQSMMGTIDPLMIREMFLVDPYQRSLLRERNPPLSEALESGDQQRFVTVFEQQKKDREERERLRIRMLQADPLDLEAQQKIAEEIQLTNINANMETAMEFSPESFGQVVMLYINCQVNGQPVKAFVDSGAQMTIMSVACAERCNIMRLVDRRWAGLAKGVGTQKIIGRVHVAQIRIGQDYLASSFSVLESQPMDMLLGLDMLKRHQCCIDLKAGVLRIGTTGTETPFLSESELPECARLSGQGQGNQEMEDHDLAEALNRSSQAAATGPSTVTSPQASSSSLRRGISEADVQRLVKMGLKREDIIKELASNGGDIDKAAAVLLTRSLVFKPN